MLKSENEKNSAHYFLEKKNYSEINKVILPMYIPDKIRYPNYFLTRQYCFHVDREKKVF